MPASALLLRPFWFYCTLHLSAKQPSAEISYLYFRITQTSRLPPMPKYRHSEFERRFTATSTLMPSLQKQFFPPLLSLLLLLSSPLLLFASTSLLSLSLLTYCLLIISLISYPFFYIFPVLSFSLLFLFFSISSSLLSSPLLSSSFLSPLLSSLRSSPVF